VPSCVDLNLFHFDSKKRKAYRNKWKIEDNTILFVYLGKLGGMYWDRELFDVFENLKKHLDRTSKLLIISREDLKPYKNFMNQDIISISAMKTEVPGLLSAADIAICGIKNIPSRRFSSPIKNGEYWACGLPIIIPEGISDDYLCAKENDIGFVIYSTNEQGLDKCAQKIQTYLSKNSWGKCKKSCRAFVVKDRSIQTYQLLFIECFC